MNGNSWIKLHTNFLKWGWIEKPEMVSLFIYLLLTANYKNKQWQGITIERGQTVIGREKLSKTLGISPQTLRTCITRLKSTNEITTKSTNKYTIITLVKYNEYQTNNKKSTNKTTNKLTNDQPTTNQQLTTPTDRTEYTEINTINKNVSELINLFKKLNPMINFGNKTYRKSAEELIEKIGFEKAINATTYAISIQGIPYAPVITNPYQLNSKYGELIGFYKKNNNQLKNINLDNL